MNPLQAKIAQLEAELSALKELLKVSEESFLKEAGKLEEANKQLVKENTYRLFFETSPEAMLTLYEDRFIDCNESTVKMLKAKNKKEVLNTHPWDLSPEYQPDGRLSSEKAEEMIAAALKKGAHAFEWYHKRVNGEVFPVEVLLTAVVFEGKQMFNSTWRDLTEKNGRRKSLMNIISTWKNWLRKKPKK
jgi:PAS domain S-box-containing protein